MGSMITANYDAETDQIIDASPRLNNGVANSSVPVTAIPSDGGIGNIPSGNYQLAFVKTGTSAPDNGDGLPDGTIHAQTGPYAASYVKKDGLYRKTNGGYAGTVMIDFTDPQRYNRQKVTLYQTAPNVPGALAAVQNGALEIGYTNWLASAGSVGADIRPLSGVWDFSGATNLAIEVESGDRENELEAMYLQVRIGDAALSWYYAWNPVGSSNMRKGRRTILPIPISKAVLSGTADLANVGRIMIYAYGVTSPYTPNPQKIRVLRIYKDYKQDRAKMVLGFDDGQLSVYQNAFEKAGRMKDLGIPGTWYLPIYNVNKLAYGSPPIDYCTEAQINETYQAGWDVGNQNDSDWKMAATFSSLVISGADPTLVTGVVTMQGWGSLAPGMNVTIFGSNIPQLNGQKILKTATYNAGNWTITYHVSLPYSIAASPDTANVGYATLMVDPVAWNEVNLTSYLNGRNYIAARWPRAADHYAVSGGVHNSAIEDMLVAAGCKSNRTTQNVNPDFLGTHFPRYDYGSLHRMPAVSLDGRTGAQGLAYLDAAIAAKTTIMIYTHGVGLNASYMLDAEFQTFITGAASRRDAGNLECLNISSWFDSRL